MDVPKQIEYWQKGSGESLRSVPTLIKGKFWTEALFWMHLAVEKALKANVAKRTQAIPPYIHNLSRLAEIADISLSQTQHLLCQELNDYQRFARYPDMSIPEPDDKTAMRILNSAMEFQQWLLNRL
ncbi:MAG: HEPN domain-containing protein [Candidatus Sumerlaeota bacterium]|nr:HEPN domain-containing protein [Candidatus Sumerlaeota bacterium]